MRRRLWIGIGVGVVAVELLVLLVAALVLGTGNSTELDVAQAEAGVTRVLTDPVDGYGAQGVSAVRCNDGKNPSAEKGSSFTCTGSVNGDQRRIDVVVVDDDGTFEVDWPR